MPRYIEHNGVRQEFPDDATDEEISAALAPGFTERVGERYSRAGEALKGLPGALGRFVSGEGGRGQAALDTLQGIAAPFEIPFAPIGEAARSGFKALAGPEGATVTTGSAELGVEPQHLTQEQYGEVGATATEISAAGLPVGKGISMAARGLKARRLGKTLGKALDEPLKAAAPAAEGIGKPIQEVIEGYKPSYIGQHVAAGEPLVLEQPGKWAYNINLPRQLDHQGARQLMFETSQAHMGRYDQLLGKTTNAMQLEDLASQSGITLDKLLSVKPGEAWNKTELLTARTMLGRSAHESFEAAQAFAKNPTASTLDDVNKLMSRHVDIQESMTLLTNEWGRSGLAFKVQPKNTNKLIERALKGISGDLDIERIRALGMMDPTDPAFVNQVGTFLGLAKKAKTRDKMFEAWVNGILSGPQTHVVNTVSNALVALTRPIETAFAAGIDIPRVAVARLGKSLGATKEWQTWLGGTERQVRLVDAFAETAGIIQGMKEGSKAMAQAWKSGVPAFPTVGPGGKTIGKLEFRRVIGGRKGRLINIPGRALIAGDEFFKGIAFRATVNKMSLRRAFKEASRDPKINIAERAAQIGRSITIEKGVAGTLQGLEMKIAKEAFSEAAYRTFQKQLGDIGSKAMGLRDRIPGARYIAPFMRTPINIAKYGLERTPLAVLYRGAQFAKGKAIVSEEWGRLALGSILGGLFAAGVVEGTISGAGPLERGKRRAQYGTGWQPYSIRIGGSYYQYGRFEPLGMVMGLSADFMEIVQRQPDLELEDTVWYISQAITQNLTNKTFLYGISNLLEAIYDPQRYGEDWAQRFVGSFIPAVIAHAGYAVDPTLRDTPGISQRVASRIPGMSDKLIPFRDIWGEEVQFRTDDPGGGVTGALWRFVSPVRVSKADTDYVAHEIRRLEPSVGTPKRELGGIELEPIEYDAYARRAGQLARPKVEFLVHSLRYERMADWEKLESLQDAFRKARQEAAKEVKMEKAFRTRSLEQTRRRIKERAAAKGGIG